MTGRECTHAGWVHRGAAPSIASMAAGGPLSFEEDFQAAERQYRRHRGRHGGPRPRVPFLAAAALVLLEYSLAQRLADAGRIDWADPPAGSVDDAVLLGLIGLAAQVLLVAGVLLVTWRRGHRLERTWRLDAVVAACGGSAVGVMLLQLAPAGVPMPVTVVAVGPVVLGLATALMVLQVVLVGGWRDSVMLWLLAALCARQYGSVSVSAIVIGLRMPIAGAQVAIVLFALCMGAAAEWERRRGRWRAPGTSSAAVAGSWIFPALCMASAVAVLALPGSRPAVVTVLAVSTLVLAVVQTAVGNREVQRVAREQVGWRTDPLTGLLNRRGFTEELGRAVAIGPGAVLVVNIDRFREVNELLGYDASDQVLCGVARRLARALRGRDVLCRLGVDEFAVVVDEETLLGALQVARRLRGVLDTPVAARGASVRINASVGVVTWGGLDDDADDSLWDPHTRSPRSARPDADRLLSRANQALRLAKQHRSGIEAYDPRRDASGAHRLALVDALRRSIARREFDVHYQPKVDVSDGRVLGVEALARWRHDGVDVPPDVFIGIAEEAELIGDLTRGMLDAALAQARRWSDDGHSLAVAVNLSPRNLLDPALPRRVSDLLTRHGVAADRLLLEITETTLMPDPIRGSVALAELRALGVRIAIDDYGTGHASLAYLRDFPVDELKLDRSYISAMVSDPRTAAIVRSTIEMGVALGLEVVAEGVERLEELHALTSSGCHLVQGFLVCRPLPAEAVTRWLDDRRAGGYHAPGEVA